MKRFFLFSVLFFLFFLSYSQKLTPLQLFLSKSELKGAGVGLLIKDVYSDKVVVSYNEETNLIPASIAKVVTTATAIEVFGDTFRFETKVVYDGVIVDSVLKGNLYVVGGGDPSLESAYAKGRSFFNDALKVIKERGIKKIEGAIVGDASLFTEFGTPTQWLVEDVGSYYAPTPSALSVFDNYFQISFEQGPKGVPYIKQVYPNSSLLSIDNRLTYGKETWWRFFSEEYSWNKRLMGTVLEKKFPVRTEIPEPALLVADSLRSLLIKNGIKVSEKSTTTRLSGLKCKEQSQKTIFSHKSDMMKNLIKKTNYRSINLYAENLFLSLSAYNRPVSDYRFSVDYIVSYWKDRGVDFSSTYLVDGSGLSMKNAMSASFMVGFLKNMKLKGKYSEAFVNSLPVAGVNGTVKSLFDGTPLKGNVYAKSGSMERVQNYCGYITYNNKLYAFCIIINNFKGGRYALRQHISELFNSLLVN